MYKHTSTNRIDAKHPRTHEHRVFQHTALSTTRRFTSYWYQVNLAAAATSCREGRAIRPPSSSHLSPLFSLVVRFLQFYIHVHVHLSASWFSLGTSESKRAYSGMIKEIIKRLCGVS